MGDARRFDELANLLREAGIPVRGGKVPCPAGFPVVLRLSDGSELVLELGEPPLIGDVHSDTFGIAVIDAAGYCRASWGLASRLEVFDPLRNTLTTAIGSQVESALRGVGGTLFQEGLRFFTSSNKRGGGGAVVLVFNAMEEGQARRQSIKSTREAEALRRFGRLLSMNQTLAPLCVAVVHELAASTKLAAALLWTLDPSRRALALAASTGTNRVGTSVLGTLTTDGDPTCIAEMVALSAQPFYLDDVQDHVMTRELEARFCYLQPGGVSIHPLYIAGNVLGVIELIGREGDEEFPELHELFQTLSEHLALAVNSAMLFESVEKLANDDALTGIANHRTMQQFLQMRLAETQRTNADLGLLMIDVDHFRSFNEEEGHDVGDDVLKHVAQILRESVRPYDLAARYGGEEFTVVLPGSGVEATLSTAERVRRQVEAMPIVTRSGRTRHITVSVGSASCPTHAQDASGLIQAADSALFQAKREGRNRVVLYGGRTTQDADKVCVESIIECLPKRNRPEAQRRLEQLEPVLGPLSSAMSLSAKQGVLLRGLAAVEGYYRRTKSGGRLQALSVLHGKDPIRVLLPSLDALDDRYDGRSGQGASGNMIPLLARILVAAAAYEARGGKAFLSDPGRFDPEIVRLILENRAAA